jgi:hypothetical protein
MALGKVMECTNMQGRGLKKILMFTEGSLIKIRSMALGNKHMQEWESTTATGSKVREVERE